MALEGWVVSYEQGAPVVHRVVSRFWLDKAGRPDAFSPKVDAFRPKLTGLLEVGEDVVPIYPKKQRKYNSQIEI